MKAFGATQEYLILKTVINEMTLRVPTAKLDEVGVRPPVNPDELEDLVAVLSKADPRVPSNWSRRFKNHQEKLKSGDVYQVAEVVRNLAARNRDAALSAGRRQPVRQSSHRAPPTAPPSLDEGDLWGDLSAVGQETGAPRRLQDTPPIPRPLPVRAGAMPTPRPPVGGSEESQAE